MIVYVLVFAVIAAFLAGCYGFYTWAMKAGDPFGPEDDPDGLPPLGTMPTEIAHEPPRPSIHELPPLGDAVWHQYPLTSPAHNPAPPACPGTGAEPGTAAAAGSLPPPPPAASPPPLPDPAYAAANGLPHEFAEWLSDTFVGRVEAIRGEAP